MRVAMFSAAFRFLLALAAALAQTASAEPALGVVPAAPWPGPSWDLSHGPLKVSSDGHYLVCSDGTPFIWIGDTAWDLFHKLTLDETERYLENRRAKGFTVVQCVLFAMNLGSADKAACGAPIFVDRDPTKPNEAFFKNVDGVVEAARKKGIYLLIFPTWGRHFCLHKYITAAMPVTLTEADLSCFRPTSGMRIGGCGISAVKMTLPRLSPGTALITQFPTH